MAGTASGSLTLFNDNFGQRRRRAVTIFGNTANSGARFRGVNQIKELARRLH